MKKIIVIGSTCSGKTTLGKALSHQLSIPYVDLDDLFWLPNWTPRPHEEFVNLIKDTIKQPTWIICGNQSKVRTLIWPKADSVIWLDLPFFLLLHRIFMRSIKQYLNQKEICNGNRQTLRQFLWLFCWLFSSYRRRKKTYFTLQKEMPNLKWIHLKTKKEVTCFLSEL